jgi:uncharacterized protein (DUF2236 family)
LLGAASDVPRKPLSPDDLDRLRLARGRQSVDPRRSLFGPRSVTWRVNREAVLLLGGGRALLLQVAHPLVAAGVLEHSGFRAAPLERLRRTLDLMLTITFADAAGAIAAVREIERVHARVRGVLDADVGPFPHGTPYDAGTPALLLWVHATLVDTALRVYERFVGPLAPAERAAYYEESKVTARLLGVPPSIIPATLAWFEEYVGGTIRGEALTVGPAAREIAAAVLRPPVALPLRPAFVLTRFLTAGLLPPPMRERYGLEWSPRRERVVDLLASASRTLLPFLPPFVRWMPPAHRAITNERHRKTSSSRRSPSTAPRPGTPHPVPAP